MSQPMLDGTHSAAHHIPVSIPKVAGYITGTPDIQWTADDWKLFDSSGHVRINQGFGSDLAHVLSCDCLDVEGRAITAQQAAQMVKIRHEHKLHTDIYASESKVAEVVAALDSIAFGVPHWYDGHVDLWLADWNLSEKTAAAKLGTQIHGLLCRAVQWASPTSNPSTLVPGTKTTLGQANLDLSITEDAWHAHKAPAAALRGLLVRDLVRAGDSLTAVAVSSDDRGKTWHK
jgi:hypothetical protein